MNTVIPHGLMALGISTTDFGVRATSVQFGQTNYVKKPMVWANQEGAVKRCQRTGIYFPPSMLVVDESGKMVGLPYALRRRG